MATKSLRDCSLAWFGVASAEFNAVADRTELIARTLPRDLVLSGAVDVHFRRGSPALLILADRSEALADVVTHVKDQTLEISYHTSVVTALGSGRGATVIVSGSGNVVCGGNYYEADGGRSRSSATIIGARVAVCLSLPELRCVEVDGAGDLQLHDLDQEALRIEVSGSGDVDADGRVRSLEIDVSGSGDVDARELQSAAGTVRVSGSGDVTASVTSTVKVRVSGSGDVTVHGRPGERDAKVSGSGDIRFA